MAQKPLIFPKYRKNTKVKLKSGQDVIIGTVVKIAVAPPGHIDGKAGTLIYLILIESFNGNNISKKGNVTTAGEEDMTAI
jgi:hypothetical protein